MDLEGVVNRLPKPLGGEDFQHRRLHHVIFEAAIDERRGDHGHRFHRVNVGRHAPDLFLHQIEFAEGLLELFALVGVFHRQPQTRLGRAGATGSKGRASEVQHRERDAQSFAERPEDVLLWHRHVPHRETSRGRPANPELRHPRLEHGESRHIGRDEESGDRSLVGTREWACAPSPSRPGRWRRW